MFRVTRLLAVRRVPEGHFLRLGDAYTGGPGNRLFHEPIRVSVPEIACAVAVRGHVQRPKVHDPSVTVLAHHHGRLVVAFRESAGAGISASRGVFHVCIWYKIINI